MPKYYRFRATTPTRRTKRCKDKDKERDVERTSQSVNNWLDLTLACTLAPSWYLRRTSWRETPPLMGLPRQLATDLRASLQFNNRPVFVFKIPQTDAF
ncbi:uncharacterized protein LOC135193747 [Vanessa tameamea]|uniref:Uncharacterized protein LOC135193747 n=1 Tax=Vanessa tameamea TaxID=334116 RepID=A0ABM4AQP5_VANTA|nr:uncharacterized protein LOC125069989 [Vanessa atalanta]